MKTASHCHRSVFAGLTALCTASLLCLAPVNNAVAEGRVHKVLLHLLDLDGRHTPAPSLFERDAYQEYLRSNPELVSGMAFDVLWKVPKGKKRNLQMRLEIRGSKNYQSSPFSRTVPVNATGFFKTWTRIDLSTADMDSIGQIVAWKVTVVEDEETDLCSHYSFLWQRPPAGPSQDSTPRNDSPADRPNGFRSFPRQNP